MLLRRHISAAIRYAALAGAVLFSGGLHAQIPVVKLVNLNQGRQIDRSQCVTVSAGAGAAYECGSLRLAHALAPVTTRGKTRQPVLLYNSEHADPRPTVYADVTLPYGASQVTVTVTLSTGQAYPRSFSAGDWTPGSTRRVAVQWDGGSMATGVYPYTLNVLITQNVYQYDASVQGEVTVVNRRDSPFGAGWWLAGMEQLIYVPRDGSFLLIAGDGSARRYLWVAPGTYWSPSIGRPDTLRARGGSYLDGYSRRLPNGSTVLYDGQFRHERTIDRLGDQTELVYDGPSLRLTHLKAPRPDGVPTWHRFAYDPAGKLTWAGLEVNGTALSYVTTLYGHGDRRITGFTDPDTRSVGFGYGDAANPFRVTSRTDKRLTTVSYRFSAAGKLSSVRVPLDNDSIVSHFDAAEGKGLTSAIAVDQAFTLLDGPRTDTIDHTTLWLTNWGAPERIRNALGDTTVLTRGDSRFPALVTQSVAANGLVSRAWFNARGTVDSTMVVNPLGDGRNATTRYQYDSTWTHFVSRITSPENEVVRMGYDPATGNRTWQQAGTDASSRVSIDYYPAGSGSGAGLPWSVRAPLSAPVTYEYDVQGNLKATVSDVTTRYLRDSRGRVEQVVSPNGATLTNRYDSMDRIFETTTTGPATWHQNASTGRSFQVPAQTLTAHTYYNAEGQPDSVARWQTPDESDIRRITTHWRYDRAGRATEEIAPDNTPGTLSDNPRASTVYDPAGNATHTRSRRGHLTKLDYDALGRLTTRTTEAAVYDPRSTTLAFGNGLSGVLSFPYYAQDGEGNFTLSNSSGTAGVRIAGETASFSYDASGNLTGAVNRDAVVRREYNPNGTLKSETQRIRTYAGADTTSHAYRLEYRYDLNGRRTAMVHPAIFGGGETSYTYEPETGALQTILDNRGGLHRYMYNAAGQVDTLVRGTVMEAFQYDPQGRLRHRVERVTGGVAHDDWLDYDPQTGKLISFTSPEVGQPGSTGSASLSYSGLGALVISDEIDRTSRGGIRRVDIYQTDALANQVVSEGYAFSLSSGFATDDPGTTRSFYEQGTGRLIRSTPDPQASWIRPDQNLFDAAGNKVFFAQDRVTGTPYRLKTSGGQWIERVQATALSERTAYFYDADDRLRVVDRRGCLTFHPNFELPVCDPGHPPPYEKRGAFEEYRYDALGRRVLVRTRQEFACTERCLQQLRRMVWDGDQMLYEIAAPGGSTATVANMEKDTALAKPFATGEYFFQTGRVEYVHGHGIDQPLRFYREEYSDSIPGASFIPQANWRGVYDMGVRDGLCYMRSWTSQPAEPPGERQIGGVDTTSSSVGTSGTETLCADVDWPAQYTWAYHQYRKGYHGPYSWMGSLAFGMRDASGLHYRRNRFYDAEQGRFTQEDPIGLAGGINLYGYANGDPVTYSDPFGLCPKSAGGDGSTESYADCPPGTTGWYAYRLSSGAGNAALNYVGGTFAACGESWACQGVLALASLGASAAPTAARGGAARMAAVRLAGTQGETAVAAATGLVKNTSVRLGRRIPDFVEAGGRTFHEAKNVRSLSYTRQLREMVENLPEGGRLIIHVRQNTHVSRAFDALGDAVQIVRTIP